MKITALITGASSGIGLELSRIHASKGGDLVLVARSTANLEALKTELENQYKIQVLIISKDLSQRDAAKEVYDETTRRGIQIDYLINNAGFGDFGHFVATDWHKEEQMISLNMTTLTHFTKLYLQDMIKRSSGKIMNVASTASFQPGPTMAVYCATKAYVLSFSEAVNNEVSDKGVSVTALCPGATNTHFKSAAGMESSKLFKNKNLPTGQEVAKYGYAAMMKGKPVAIHGTLNFILANSARFIPRSWVVKVARMVIE
jgi:short-subunit dehydrogenase